MEIPSSQLYPPLLPSIDSNGNTVDSLPGKEDVSPVTIDKTSPILTTHPLEEEPEEDLNLQTVIEVIKRRSWIIVGVAAVVTSLIAVQTLRQEKIFEGRFRLLVEPVNADDDFSDFTSLLDAPVNKSGLDYETQVQVLRSPELLNPVVQELQQTYAEIDYLTLLKNLRITRPEETKILEIRYSGPDFVQNQVVLDILSSAYLKYSLAERQTNLRQGINFIEAQLPELQAQVNDAQQSLASFRREHKFVTPELQSSQLSSHVSSLTEQRLLLDQRMAQAEYTADSLQDDASTKDVLKEADLYKNLLAELQTVDVKLSEELTRFSPNSLTIKVLEERRDNIIPLLEKEEQRVISVEQSLATKDVQRIVVQSDVLTRAEQAANEGLDQLPLLIMQHTDLQRELEISTEALSRFRLTRETLKIEAAQTEIPWQLIEAPVLSEEPISPNLRKDLLIGAIAGIFLGLGAALLAEKLDNVYHSTDELKAGTKLPMLGILPFNSELQDDKPSKTSVIESVREKLIQRHSGTRKRNGYYGYGGSESGFLEAVRVLHTNICVLSSDTQIRSIIVSSAMPGDGKSTVCENLAQVAAAMGQRVLLVDVDLRKPQVHKRLDLSNKQGLSNLISKDLPLKSVLQQIDSSRQLFAITAGTIPPDPTKLLSSGKMKNLMRTFERCFDLVIYDAPPTMGLADVSIIGQRTDGLVLVSRIGETDKAMLTQTLETLKTAKVPTLGIVANGVRNNRSNGYLYYSYEDESQTAEIDTPKTARIE